MKNIKKIIAVSIVCITCIPVLVSAKTDVTLSPSIGSVSIGGTFSVLVDLSAVSESAYTSKVSLNYPADMLEVVDFDFAPVWFPLSQPGYDAIDNVNGNIIKTAGYPKGLNGTKSFGTVTFVAKKSGDAQISVASGTQIYDSQNRDVYTGSQNLIHVVIEAPLPVKAVVMDSAAASSSTSTSDTVSSTSSQVAAASDSGISWIVYLIILIILACIGLYVWFRKGKSIIIP